MATTVSASPSGGTNEGDTLWPAQATAMNQESSASLVAGTSDNGNNGSVDMVTASLGRSDGAKGGSRPLPLAFSPPKGHNAAAHSLSGASATNVGDARHARHARRAEASADAQLGGFTIYDRREDLTPSDALNPTSSRRAKEFIGEDELLALVVEIKLRADSTAVHSSPRQTQMDVAGKSASKSHFNGKATTSSSSADTIDLCHRKIQTLPAEMVDIIKDDLVRLALGYNFISSLPSTFLNLTRLRYLNVRANYLTSIPDVITHMPALEILDISRNKIRTLPRDPGRLLELRVLSISNNRLKRLPLWIADAKHLRILKIESNPLIWPPASVTTLPTLEMAASDKDKSDQGEAKQAAFKRAEDRQMLVWISTLKKWLIEHAHEASGAETEHVVGKPLNSVEEATEQPNQVKDGEVAIQVASQQPAMPEYAEPAKETDGAMTSMRAEPPRLLPLHTAGESPANVSSVMSDSDKQVLATESDTDVTARIDRHQTLARNSTPEEGINVSSHSQHPAKSEQGMAEDIAGIGIRSDEQGTEQSRGPSEATPFDHGAVDDPTRDMQASINHHEDINRPQDEDPAYGASALRSSVDDSEKVDQGACDVSDIASDAADAQEINDLSENTNDKTIGAPGHKVRQAVHNRNNSHTLASPATPQRMSRIGLMRSKKSLPDLRQNHGMILMDRRAGNEMIPEHEDEEREISESESVQNDFQLGSAHDAPLASTPIRPRGTMDTDTGKRSIKRVNFNPDEEKSYLGHPSAGAQRLRGGIRDLTASNAAMSTAIESERNSYFKRLSTLPASSISKSISVPVLQCVDATRGVLYALSQVHTALKHYVTFATDERMTSQLSRVLDIAGSSMANLIHALDRFDSLSRMRGSALDPIVVRGVLSACIESIATFRKLVHVVHVQLKSLQMGADTRYSRTLLLLLYGSLGEISMSWTSMEPLLGEVALYLSPDVQIHHSTLTAPNLPSIAETSSTTTPTSARALPPPARPQRRRHAGSFSARDVAQGAIMSGPLHTTPASETDDGKKLHRPPALTSISEPRLLNYQAVQGAIGSNPGATRASHAVGSNHGSVDLSAAQRHRTSADDTSQSGFRSAAIPQGYSMYGHSQIPAALPIDDHLLMLVVKITSIAFSVWAGIEDHLIALGLPVPSSTSSRSQSAAHLASNGLTPSDSSMLHSPSTAAKLLEDSLARTATEQDVRSLQDADQDTKGVAGEESAAMLSTNLRSNVSPTTQRKLRQLYDLMRGVHEHTHRLQVCLERAQDATEMTPMSFNSPPMSSMTVKGQSSGSSMTSSVRNGRKDESDAGTSLISGEGRDSDGVLGADQSLNSSTDLSNHGRVSKGAYAHSDGVRMTSDIQPHAASAASHELFSESGQFIKSVLHISHYIKGLAAEGFVLPKHIKTSIAELTTCARDLTLHLHFLSGPTPLQVPTSSGAIAGPSARSLANGFASQQQQFHNGDKGRTMSASASNSVSHIRTGPASIASAPPNSTNNEA